MKYFTLDWWEAGCDERMVARYLTQLYRQLDQFPQDLVKLADRMSLHNAKLLSFQYDNEISVLKLDLDGYAYDEDFNVLGGRRFFLNYKNVLRLQSQADPQKGLEGPFGYGDVGYDEIEVVSAGLFEHRLLFSSGIELNIQFRDVELIHIDP